MKHFLTICLLLTICFETVAQNNADTSQPLNFYPSSQLKATIYLKDDAVITGTIKNITDSFVLVSLFLKSGTDSTAYDTIHIPDIQTIKIKRNALWLGMGCGAVAGGFVGYGLGYITYSDNASISEVDNKDKQHIRGGEGAIIVAVPGAVVGGIIGSIGFKRKFIINGDKENLRKMMKTLWEYN